MKKVLLTGSEGFVGRHFLVKLALTKHQIDLVDVRAGIDARDFFRTCNTKYDAVIHLAAIVGGRETIDRSPLKVAVDLSIDAEMFQFTLRTKPSRVVYFSSSAAYPTGLQMINHPWQHQRWKLNEEDIDLNNIESPDMTYGFAKLAGEYQAKFLEAEGIRTHVFRPFSGYGNDQDLDYPFPSFMQRAANRDNPFKIWGNGEACRDFIHIEDVIDGAWEAIKQDVQGPVNLGTGRATSFNELAELAAAEMNYNPEFEHVLDKPVGVDYRVADTVKLNSFFTPRVTLEEGIHRALKEYR